MACSIRTGKSKVLAMFKDRISKDSKILDVGAGLGTYSNLFNGFYENIDAVEVYEPYIRKYDLKSKYKNVFNVNVVDFKPLFKNYDVLIFGDVLEHLSVDDAIDVIDECVKNNIITLVCVPYQLPQRGRNNRFEDHIQDDLTHELMLERYPDLKPFLIYKRIGYYIFMRE